MSRGKDAKPLKEAQDVREARLAAVMRENLLRRKRQQRARQAPEKDKAEKDKEG